MIPSFGTHPKPRPSIAGKGVPGRGVAGKGVTGGKVGSGGKGLGIGGMKRHRYVYNTLCRRVVVALLVHGLVAAIGLSRHRG